MLERGVPNTEEQGELLSAYPERTCRSEFEEEVVRRIKEGVLIPWKGELVSRVLLLMTVVQPTKDTVRLVLDFQKMNGHVVLRHTGVKVTDVCGETLHI